MGRSRAETHAVNTDRFVLARHTEVIHHDRVNVQSFYARSLLEDQSLVFASSHTRVVQLELQAITSSHHQLLT